jgi:hypothetical protein
VRGSRSRSRSRSRKRSRFVERRYIFGLTYENTNAAPDTRSSPREKFARRCSVTEKIENSVRKLRCLLVDEEILKNFDRMVPAEHWDNGWCPRVVDILDQELSWGGLPLETTDDSYKYRFHALREMAKLYHNEGQRPRRPNRPWAHALHDITLVVPALEVED